MFTEQDKDFVRKIREDFRMYKDVTDALTSLSDMFAIDVQWRTDIHHWQMVVSTDVGAVAHVHESIVSLVLYVLVDLEKKVNES